jgi:hypothetical protein
MVKVMNVALIDSWTRANAEEAFELAGNLLESSTEYSMIATDWRATRRGASRELDPRA